MKQWLQEKVIETKYRIDQLFISKNLHKWGLNIHMMGRLAKSFNVDKFLMFLEMEMVCRAIKVYFFYMICQIQMNQPHEVEQTNYEQRNYYKNFLNSLLDFCGSNKNKNRQAAKDKTKELRAEIIDLVK